MSCSNADKEIMDLQKSQDEPVVRKHKRKVFTGKLPKKTVNELYSKGY